MSQIRFPFLGAQRCINEACDWLDTIHVKQGGAHEWSPERALYAGQTWLRHAISILQSVQATAETGLSEPIPGDDAAIAARKLKKFSSEVFASDLCPSVLTSGMIIALRGFLELNYPEAISAERSLQREMEKGRAHRWLDSR